MPPDSKYPMYSESRRGEQQAQKHFPKFLGMEAPEGPSRSGKEQATGDCSAQAQGQGAEGGCGLLPDPGISPSRYLSH
jgi:hypothetical protein